jgi:hypothetical protein
MEELIKELKEIRERAEVLNERLYAYIECEGMREIEALEYGPIIEDNAKNIDLALQDATTAVWNCLA